MIYRLLILVSMLFMGAGQAWAQGAPTRSITNVAGNLYRFQNNFHNGVFLVGEKGVLLVDPINSDVAAWIKGEIKSRFGKDVIYVAYSHNHADHTSGGEVFADTAQFIAQKTAAEKIKASGHTAPAGITFEDRYELEIAGETVEFIYPGPTHSDNLIVVRFPAEKALFVVDMASVKRLPFMTLPEFHLPEIITNLRAVEALDFDIFVGGHGPIGGKADLSEHIAYLDEMYGAVKEGVAAGLSLEEIQAKVTMEAYKDWVQFEAWRPLNIQGMYKIVTGGE